MKKLGLINYEGDCLKAIKEGNMVKIIDQYGETVNVLTKQEVLLFVDGSLEIIDSKNKTWNYTKESKEAKPTVEEIVDFLELHKKIKNALISVYDKNNLEPMVRHLHENNITIYSTGGTAKFITDLGIPVIEVQDITNYPSILGGRVKTLHPTIFGGILSRRDNKEDLKETKKYKIPEIDLVIVDLYPFEETVNSGASFEEIVEKIDIGGVSLIRAAAKNFNDVVVLCNDKKKNWFLSNKITKTSLQERMDLALVAFKKTKKYDKKISDWFKNYES